MIICAPCKAIMKIHKNGVRYLEIIKTGASEIWATDEYICPECGNIIAYTNPNQSAFLKRGDKEFASYVMNNEVKKFWSEGRPMDKEG